jgi:type IV secretory pathway VirB2 component (pilin)
LLKIPYSYRLKSSPILRSLSKAQFASFTLKEKSMKLASIKQKLVANAPVIAAAAVMVVGGAELAMAGTDATFNTALTKFTDFLEGSGGKIITVLSLAGGVVGLASGRFSLGQVAIPVGVGVGAGTGIPIVTSTVTATV